MSMTVFKLVLGITMGTLLPYIPTGTANIPRSLYKQHSQTTMT